MVFMAFYGTNKAKGLNILESPSKVGDDSNDSNEHMSAAGKEPHPRYPF